MSGSDSELRQEELRCASGSILKLKQTIDGEECPLEDFKLQVDAMLTLLRQQLRVKESQPLTYSSATWEHLDELNITPTGFIDLKPSIEDRIAVIASLGQDEVWSSANLYHQVHLLENVASRVIESSTRLWIEAFLFRASAMLLAQDKPIVLNLEQVVPAIPSTSPSFSGFAEGSVTVASPCIAGSQQHHDLTRSQMASGFFIIEAKVSNPTNHIPQAVCEMYACGKALQKKVIRGAVTNGHVWIFLLVRLNDDYDGSFYIRSTPVKLVSAGSFSSQLDVHHEPDLIAGILAYWIENSSEDLRSDDWFKAL